MLFICILLLMILFVCGCTVSLQHTEQFDENELELQSKTAVFEEDSETIKNDENNQEIDLGPPTDVLEKQQQLIGNSGWWTDTINCSKNGSTNIYCKPKNQWIWPY